MKACVAAVVILLLAWLHNQHGTAPTVALAAGLPITHYPLPTGRAARCRWRTMRPWTNSGPYRSNSATCQASQSGSPGLTSHAGGESHPIWALWNRTTGPLPEDLIQPKDSSSISVVGPLATSRGT